MPRWIFALMESRFSVSQRSSPSCVSRTWSKASSGVALRCLNLSFQPGFECWIVDSDVHGEVWFYPNSAQDRFCQCDGSRLA